MTNKEKKALEKLRKLREKLDAKILKEKRKRAGRIARGQE